jgi:hypothetical protein
MLDSSGLPKSWWGEAILTACFTLNRVPSAKGEITPYEGWKGRKPSFGFLRAWGYLVKVNVPACKKRKLGPKTVDCIFLGYAHNSTTYRFLVIKSEFLDVQVNILTKLRDATFFEYVFSVKDRVATCSEASTSYTLEPSAVSLPTVYIEQPIDDNNTDTPRRSNRQRVENSFGDDFIIYLVDDTPKTLTEAYTSPDVEHWKEVDGCKPVGCKWVFKKKMNQMTLLINLRLGLWSRDLPKRKARIILIPIHQLLG